MKQVRVFGPGCQKCHLTRERVERVIAATQVEAQVEEVSDYRAIVAAGVLSTPAVAVDGTLRLAGRVPSEKEIAEWLVG